MFSTNENKRVFTSCLIGVDAKGDIRVFVGVQVNAVDLNGVNSETMPRWCGNPSGSGAQWCYPRAIGGHN